VDPDSPVSPTLPENSLSVLLPLFLGMELTLVFFADLWADWFCWRPCFCTWCRGPPYHFSVPPLVLYLDFAAQKPWPPPHLFPPGFQSKPNLWSLSLYKFWLALPLNVSSLTLALKVFYPAHANSSCQLQGTRMSLLRFRFWYVSCPRIAFSFVDRPSLRTRLSRISLSPMVWRKAILFRPPPLVSLVFLFQAVFFFRSSRP